MHIMRNAFLLLTLLHVAIGFSSISSKSIRSTSTDLFPDPTAVNTFLQSSAIHGILATGLTIAKQKSLTKQGLIHATGLGIGLWTLLGVSGWSICVIYLIFGSLVTKVKIKEKEALGIAEKRGGARGPENVWGSAAVAITCAMLAYSYPQFSVVLKAGYVGSLATKLSDTFASEIGKAYGKTTYLITTMQRVPRGTEGAISVEGTLAGIAGSVVMAVAGLLFHHIDTSGFVACVVAAFLANNVESYIGATFQDNIPWLTNELVNLINTLIGALIAISMASLLR